MSIVKTCEMTGPSGKIIVNESDVEDYKSRGYEVCTDANKSVESKAESKAESEQSKDEYEPKAKQKSEQKSEQKLEDDS